jgi:hypothetical protein
MSESHFTFNLSQAQFLLDRVAMFVQTHPFESSVALAVASLGGYTLRHLITPSPYPNIDGPSSSSVVFGTRVYQTPKDLAQLIFACYAWSIGHLYDIHSAQGTMFQDELQDKYGSVCKVGGILGVSPYCQTH